MNEWKYSVPTKIVFGTGALEKIKECVDNFSPKNILLVTGKKSMEKLGVIDEIRKFLNGYNIIHFNEVEPNPSIQTVEKGIELCKNEKCDLVIGLGGGSAMDAAKTIAILYNNKGKVKEYLDRKRKIKNKGLPVIEITSTSGTASEITRYAVITDVEEKSKKVIHHDLMHPDFAIIYPKLTKSMPKKLTATTGMDTLSHAVESYWSKNANPITEFFALKSIELNYNNLLKAIEEPDNMEYRKNMSLASLFAGLAFDNTGTNVMHSLSFPITSLFGIPHGHACCLTMTGVMKFNKDVAEDKLQKIAEITGTKDVEKGIENIQKFLEGTGLPMKLSEFGLDEKDIDKIIRDGFRPEKMKTNPKSVTEDVMRKILLDAL